VVRVRRSVVIADGVLRRVLAPQGTYARSGGSWRTLDASTSRLAGGQGTAERPPALEEYHLRRGRLGVRIAGRDDRHLPDIPALIDPRQFDLISKPGSGMVVIQGGAGSGKTTIGLHRMAYLTFNDPRRFSPDKMLVVVFNDALVSYISRVLPSLGVEGVQVITFTSWASRQRKRHLPTLPDEYTDDTPSVVTKMKKHPAMLRLIDERVARETAAIAAQITTAVANKPESERVTRAWDALTRFPIAPRVSTLGQWARGDRAIDGVEPLSANDTRNAVATVVDRVKPRARDVVWDWAELITDLPTLREGFARLAPGAMTDVELSSAVRYCADRVGETVVERPEETDDARDAKRDATDADAPRASERDEALAEMEPAERPAPRPRRDGDDDDDDRDNDEDDNPYLALDGVDETGRPTARLDREDDALFLRLFQRKRGSLRKDKKQPLLYEHIFVDEAQDLSPVELGVLMDCATPAQSVTLAGDTAQRLLLDNGFTDWQGVLRDLGYHGVSVEPLKIGYRSTREVLDFARAVLGPLADPEPPIATRSGAAVELHRFPDPGAAVAFLGQSLRDLSLSEPRANVAVITRDPERADVYFEGLKRAEVPRLKRVAEQDFSFKPGVEVTDIRQVKGLEFDYVVLVDVTAGSYPVTSESRHLLHIGATRAAHQLWIVAAGQPSDLLPESMRD
jgi:DNA helicase-2/ATP-dependent DNA helicase PcrA